MLLMALEAGGEAAEEVQGGRYWQVCICGGRGVTGEIKEGRVGIQD